MNFRTAIDRLSERIDDSSKVLITHRNACLLAGSNHLAAFADRSFFVEQNGTDAVIGNILYHSFDAVFKKNDLAVHCMSKSMHRDNAVTCGLYESDLSLFCGNLEILCCRPENGNDLVLTDCCSCFFTCAVDSLADLVLASPKTPVVLLAANLKDEAAPDFRVLHDVQFHIVCLILPLQERNKAVCLFLIRAHHTAENCFDFLSVLCHIVHGLLSVLYL